MALANVFQSNSSLKLIDVNFKDNGGLGKIFGIMGDLSPSIGMSPEPMTGAQVRAQAVDGVKMMARPTLRHPGTRDAAEPGRRIPRRAASCALRCNRRNRCRSARWSAQC